MNARDRIQRTDLFQQIFVRAQKLLFLIYLTIQRLINSARLDGQTEFVYAR